MTIRRIVDIPADGVHLEGALELPGAPVGLVVFAHGSGSSRSSPRNRFVARELQRHDIGTLLFDLLTESEDAAREARFDIDLLALRLAAAARWARQNPATSGLPLGLFGASTGAAAALRVAASMPSDIVAVVSRGGRPDLAGADALARAKAPTLLIVGGADAGVIELNEQALERLGAKGALEIVPGATHLFEEPGALEQVASGAARWFARQFALHAATAGNAA